uniref:Inosine-5'-monophosphate dehydrogenase (IMP dehydrogenase) (IMPD) (IMPDH) (EC) n=1 Tax=Ganoderma boninense TaxID=34458 RepID=A0A5K1K3W7_9APHY|nr:Inosine-5'-monophosphate dehydrogenase (IMP dehydrogenase) (IMPD) (IMPDH) (EC [Ganoderma boninense]
MLWIRRHALEEDQDLNLDVFQLVMDQLQQQDADLCALASSSRKLRSLAFLRLFCRCKVDTTQPGPHDPPQGICSYVRHITQPGRLDQDGDLLRFETLLGQFPSLNSVTLKPFRGKLPWDILKACLVRSHLISLTIDLRHNVLDGPLYPQDDIADTPTSLRTFTLTSTVWREWGKCRLPYRRLHPADMRPFFDFERACITGIVLNMRSTVVSLSLPIESAPILAMAEVSWPCLRDLSLHGRFLDVEHASSLQHLLPAVPSLRSLSVLAGRIWDGETLGRYLVLPEPSSASSLPPLSSASNSSLTSGPHSEERSERATSLPPMLSELRSLTIAFPHPDDGIFSLSMPFLTHLSVRDRPWIYHQLPYGFNVSCGPLGKYWAVPLLSSEESLSVLQRMDLSCLTSLELALPRLEHLELHRYRELEDREGLNLPVTDRVEHTHIAQLLSAAKTLRTLRLNLDFPEDHQAYCANQEKRDEWLVLFRERGPEIVEIVATSCPRLEHVALLYHGYEGGTWAEFHPQRCAEPRFVLDDTREHLDEEPLQREWESM